MPRIHGRNARFYMNLTSGGTPEPITFIHGFAINQAVDFVEVTALGDTNKVRVAGLPDASGTLDGFYDTSTVQTFTAALDGVARRAYMYTDVNTTPSTNYWFGCVFVDFSFKTGAAEAASITGNWVAASAFNKQP